MSCEEKNSPSFTGVPGTISNACHIYFFLEALKINNVFILVNQSKRPEIASF